MSLSIEYITEPTQDARALIDELDAELNGPYAPEQWHGLSIERVFQPGVLFFIARLNGDAVGCGGIALDDGWAEVKRMYVRPHARRGKVAQAILAHLETVARTHGVTRIALETGDVQQAALRFYESAGFTRCEAFGTYVAMPAYAIERSVFFEKKI